jgi:hypothetical protein
VFKKRSLSPALSKREGVKECPLLIPPKGGRIGKAKALKEIYLIARGFNPGEEKTPIPHCGLKS